MSLLTRHLRALVKFAVNLAKPRGLSNSFFAFFVGGAGQEQSPDLSIQAAVKDASLLPRNQSYKERRPENILIQNSRKGFFAFLCDSFDRLDSDRIAADEREAEERCRCEQFGQDPGIGNGGSILLLRLHDHYPKFLYSNNLQRLDGQDCVINCAQTIA